MRQAVGRGISGGSPTDRPGFVVAVILFGFRDSKRILKQNN
jgi:hypothetical protein